MASRYPQSSRKSGNYYGTATAKGIVRRMVGNGSVSTRVTVLQESERLEIVAHRVYGDASLWWIIAAASNIGWGLQVPAGTRLIIPTDINAIISAIG